jgi:hypothetical protein
VMEAWGAVAVVRAAAAAAVALAGGTSVAAAEGEASAVEAAGSEAAGAAGACERAQGGRLKCFLDVATYSGGCWASALNARASPGFCLKQKSTLLNPYWLTAPGRRRAGRETGGRRDASTGSAGEQH